MSGSLLLCLWMLQKLLIPTSGYLMDVRGEAKYLRIAGLNDVKSFLFNTMIIGGTKTEICAAGVVPPKKSPIINVNPDQAGMFAKESLIRKVGCTFWLILLIVGAVSVFSMGELFNLRFKVGMTLLSQVAVHLFFGSDPFLYCIHFAPPLVLIASMASNSRYRGALRVLVIAVIVCASIENAGAYSALTHFLKANHVVS